MATIAMAIALFQSHWAVANETVAARRAGTKNKLGAKQQAPMAPGPRRRRRRGRGAKGAEIETPKASSGERYGEGVSPPHPTRGSVGAS